MPKKQPSSKQPQSLQGSEAPSRILQRLKDRSKLNAIMDAVGSVDLRHTTAWHDLTELADNPKVEAVEAVPEGIFETAAEHGFAASATIYVALDGGDGVGFAATDSFPAQVRGHFEPDGSAVVDSVSVDTSSFL
jgi:hypothetical protein